MRPLAGSALAPTRAGPHTGKARPQTKPKKRRKLRRSKVPEGVGHFGGAAVSETLPPVDFVSENGEVIFTRDQIVRGEEVLHLRDLI